jgi:hypothetical protein
MCEHVHSSVLCELPDAEWAAAHVWTVLADLAMKIHGNRCVPNVSWLGASLTVHAV